MSLLALQSLEVGRVCAKRWRADGVCESYGSIVWWRPLENRAVGGIVDLAEALERLEVRPDLCIVRGTLINPGAGRIRRAMQGPDAGLRDGDRSWMCCDLDTLETTPDLRAQLRDDPWGGIELAARFAVELLPEWLHGVSFVAQWSQSAGRDGYTKAKLHLWFWLDRPVCCASLSEWSSTIAALDPAVCRPVQPIYTSRPIIEDGWTFGPSRRTILIPGARASASPPPEIVDIATWQAAKDARDAEQRAKAAKWAEADRYRSPAARASRGARHMDAVVRKALDEMASAPESRRHGTLMRSAAAIARTAQEIDVDPTQDLEVLAQVARARLPSDRSDEPKAAIDYVLRTL